MLRREEFPRSTHSFVYGLHAFRRGNNKRSGHCDAVGSVQRVNFAKKHLQICGLRIATLFSAPSSYRPRLLKLLPKMKFLKFLVDKRSRDSADHAANAATGVLPPINLTSPTRPIKSAGNGEKKPKVGKLTLYMLLSDI
ncbi:hypothetical protein F441_20463 [Phytophthora nicotianae CJ01A1]|uniref:Uncharacterized protein n=1 Tax=Phytophthora nicotianae CJ01A1 TaxID=1317063 RepID=W2VW00_PHYNI|nr:hypothetical protein F441_20463 [Phytophthora nicotianae CJ01A1]